MGCACKGTIRRATSSIPRRKRSEACGLGERALLTSPSLPLSIRVLDSVFPCGRIGHAKLAPYAPDATAAARASGRRFEVIDVCASELRYRGSHKEPPRVKPNIGIDPAALRLRFTCKWFKNNW